jgi:two-component system, OmpR family, alkaline phosphatase synthesis response regulator PhoP
MKKGARILLVEDEQTLARGLEYNLSAEGYVVILANDGKKALKKLQSEKYDMVILDIMLPYVDGFDIAGQIRAEDQQLPILFLTARSGIKDRLRGLELGADDYMTKPFHLEELLLKVKGMMRRKAWYKEASGAMPVYKIGNWEVNFDNLRCTNPDKEIHLTLHEAMLLKYLIEHKGSAVSRKELLDKVWNISSEIETRTVDNFIARLRKYFEDDPDNPVYIKSIRGVGYLFNG